MNRAAYLRAQASLAMRPVYEPRRWGAIASQILEHVRHAARIGKQETGSQEGFTLNARSAFSDLSARSFLELCLSENDRRLAPYDPRLLRPALLPGGVRVALAFLRRHPSPPRGQSPQRAPLAKGPPSSGADSA